MKIFRYNATRSSVQKMHGLGIVEVGYSGPLSQLAFDTLKTEVLQHTAQAPVLVLRMDRCLQTFEMPEPPTGYNIGSPAGAVIVRADQFKAWNAYGKALSRVGVMRVVFLESHASLAYQWALGQVSHGGRECN